MKKVVLTALLIVFAFAAFASANTYTYTPTPKDLYDLDHYKFYTWGINWTHSSETIIGASLKIYKVYDWQHEVDSLYIHLLDQPALGVTTFTDNQGGGDNFSGQGRWVTTWSDPYGDPQHKANLTYDLGALGLLPSLNTYAADGRFGFGFDPDCHYYNDSVQVCITTGNIVPEPTTLTLLGLGLLGVGVLALRRK